MKTKINAIKVMIVLALFFTVITFPTGSSANHSWGNYHWARTANPFTLKLGDNVTSAWDSYLSTASADWSRSTVLDTVIVPGNGSRPRRCSPTAGRVEVCDTTYGQNGWLGLASIWASGSHITQGTVKLNDTYFNMSQYNTPAWRQLVMCQEVAHTFGLDHQDENFNNPNLGTCMDYTSDPDGPPSNTGPNQHDFDQLATIYEHLDSTTTVGFTAGFIAGQSGQEIDTNDPREWGNPIAANNAGRAILFLRDLGNDNKLFTFVYWAEEPRGNRPE